MFKFSRLTGWLRGAATAQPNGDQSAQPNTQSNSPKSVTEDSALQQSAVWRCVRILSETIASLPIKIFEKDKKGELKEVEDAPNNPLWFVLTQSPNKWQTVQEWLETFFLNLVLHGNAFNQIERVNGKIVGLIPLPAQNMTVKNIDGEPVYIYIDPTGDTLVIAYENMWHCKLFGNGLIGLSPLGYAKGSIGLASAAEEYSSKFFTNGGKPAGVVSTDKLLTSVQREQLRKVYNIEGEISEEKHRNMILEAGMKYQAVQARPDEMQMLQTRSFQIEDISRFFGVPLFLLNSTEKSTTWGSGLGQIMSGFYLMTLRPYLTRFEQGARKHLMTPQQRRNTVIVFDFDELLRADLNTRADIDAKEINSGIHTINEIRKKRNLPAIKGGDVPMVNSTFTPIDQVGKMASTHIKTTQEY